MKISIDLNDPKIQAQLEQALDAKVKEVLAERADAFANEIVIRKIERVLTDKWIQSTAETIIQAFVASSFNTNSSLNKTKFNDILLQLTKEYIQETFAEKGK